MKIRKAARYLITLIPFVLLDLTLRSASGSAEWYPVYSAPPILFSLGFGALFLCAALAYREPKWSRVVYAVVYTLWAVYAIIQYGVWRILGRFLFLSDFSLAGEGIGFIRSVKQILDARFILLAALMFIWGAVGVMALPKQVSRRNVCPALLCVFALSQFLVPRMYNSGPTAIDWDAWRSMSYEYQKFSSSEYDLAITGTYQFVARDAVLSFLPDPNDNKKRECADSFFANAPLHNDNVMTGLLKGRNLIMIQLESIDDFVLNETNTPTLARLQSEAICFSEFYTPQYSAGYTFNTEFAAQTGLYPYTNGSSVSVLSRNAFPYTLANMLSKEGYTANSFHKGSAEFYNRGVIHKAFGYEKYNSATDYAQSEFEAEDDRFLIDCNAYYEKMIYNQPFLDFIITYSAHLGYDENDALTTKALNEFPEYSDPSRTYDVNGLYAKARLTDGMFERLLKRLEADGLMDNIVLCVYGDHYAYGLSDRTMLEDYSYAAGGRLLERTPCFIWYKGCEPVTIDKTLQTVDLLPTLANMFNLPAPRTMGRDAFDPDYEGYVIFQNAASWMNGRAYVENGIVKWNNGMSDEEIQAMNAYVQRFHEANDAVLDIDYFRNLYPTP